MQTYIALYTLNYEYVVLPHSIIYFITLKIIIKEVVDNLLIGCVNLYFVSRSTVYEKNNGSIFVTTIPRITLK